MRYRLPKGMRYSTLGEREDFYSDEFRLDKASKWLSRRCGHSVFAVIIGRHTKIYPRKFAQSYSKSILIDDYGTLQEVRNLILEFVPEAVYYDRNIYSKGSGSTRKILGQELAFDLDPENVTCPIHGSLKDKMRRRQGLSFCILEFKKIREKTLDLHERLSKMFNEVSVVYSGRGFHIHIFDAETLVWTRRQRRKLALQIKREGYPIDEWVTTGGMRLIRLPYSLHGMVSRIVLPVSIAQLERFDPLTSSIAVPRFLQKS